MTVALDLSPEREAAVVATAQAQGISTEQWLERIVSEQLQNAGRPGQDLPVPEPFWRAFTQRLHTLPEEVFESLPTDGASEHDHYLYGSPKKNL